MLPQSWHFRMLFILTGVNLFFISHKNFLYAKDSNIVRMAICTSEKDKIKSKKSTKALLAQVKTSKNQTVINYCSDKDLNWQQIDINVRGNSSKSFAKKQYSIDLLDGENEKIKLSLLGMSESDEWVLNAPYVDRSLLRNALAYRISRFMGYSSHTSWFAPSTKFVELYLNDSFMGVYLLVEKIQRGSDHINIPKVKLDRPEKLSFIAEVSSYTFDHDFTTKSGTHMEYKYPSKKKFEKWEKKDSDKVKDIKKSIQKEINDFEKVLKKSSFKDPETGYAAYINVDSFVDYLLVQEVFKNADGYARSVYLYKEHGGKIHMGPIWDFNLAMGNLQFFGLGKTKKWLYKKGLFSFKPVFWFKRLMKDPAFREKVQDRFWELRDSTLSDRFIDDTIDQLSSEVKNVAKDDLVRWKPTYGIIEKYFMTTKEKKHSHKEHVEVLRKWLHERLAWMDEKICRL